MVKVVGVVMVVEVAVCCWRMWWGTRRIRKSSWRPAAPWCGCKVVMQVVGVVANVGVVEVIEGVKGTVCCSRWCYGHVSLPGAGARCYAGGWGG